MPPKWSKKSLAQRGSVSQHQGGFRAQASIGGRTHIGPSRATKAEANCDLRAAQAASSDTEYCDVLQRLRENSQSNDVALVEPAKVQGEPLRKRLRMTSSCAPDSAGPTSMSSVPAQSSSRGLCRPKVEAGGTAAAEVLAEASMPDASPSGLRREGSKSNLAQSLCLRGLNIQYPFS